MSALHNALSDYLAMRRALGTQLAWPESSLRRFVDFVEGEGAEFITSELALRWATQSAGVQRATLARRLGIVRGFATYLQTIDARTQVPAQRLLPARRCRPEPHIYADQEISDLMAATDRLRSRSGLRRAAFKTLLGLLAATGLRPGEVLALDIADVNLVDGILVVRESKFGKSRFVPMEESTRAALAAYAKFRDTTLPRRDSPAFFTTERGTRIPSYLARCTFAALCQAVGLRRRVHPHRIGRGPRLQDIRHTFATRRLIRWYTAGADIDRLMPRLSTFLGHVSVANTYWYIQAVPELLCLATERLETTVRGGEQ